MEFGNILVHGTLHQTSNAGIQVGIGTIANRPTPAVGLIRYNSDLSMFETYGTEWANIGSVSNVELVGIENAITVSGSPITNSGTFTLSLAGELAGINALNSTGIVQRTETGVYTAVAILPIANGGTGAETAPEALIALGALPTAGGTMTGALTLADDPESSLQAATKSYVDNSIANAVSMDAYTASSGILLTDRNFTASTSGVTTGIVSNNIVVISSTTIGQILLSSGTADEEASWGALDLSSANAVANSLALSHGGTGGTTAETARINLVVPSFFRESFTNGSLVSGILTVTHNLGQQFVQVMIMDNTNSVIQPDAITMLSTTASSVDLTSYGTITDTWNIVVIG